MPDQPVPRKRPTRWWYWWPFLLGPAAILACYLSFPEDYTRELYKPFLEKLALVLASSALGLGIIRLAWQRLEYHLLLTLLSGAVLLREIHWDWTTTFVYAAVVILAAWGWCWRRRIDRFLESEPLGPMLACRHGVHLRPLSGPRPPRLPRCPARGRPVLR